jgi:hypothetical protein
MARRSPTAVHATGVVADAWRSAGASRRLPLCILLASCTATIRGYEGEELASDATAVIVCRAAKVVRITIVDVDGRPLDEEWGRGDRLELEPGSHTVTLDVAEEVVPDTGGGATNVAGALWELMADAVIAASARRARAFVVVSVEAGVRYEFTARVPSEGRSAYEITVSGTDAVVARHPAGG